MTDNTKSLIKSTILGLLGGGAISALYSYNSNKKERAADSEFNPDEITVPLSRRNFLKAVRSGKEREAAGKTEAQAIQDISKMSPQEVAAFKRSLLKKRAECCNKRKGKVREINGPVTSEMQIQNKDGVNSTVIRDKKGRFASEESLAKRAGIADDAAGTMQDSLGMIGGLTAGVVAVKLINDRILANRKKRQVEDSRRRYVNALTAEVNDEDTPYYSKTAASRGGTGTTLGLLGLTGILTGTAAGTVLYRIMENRREEAERAKDKDLNKYPADKTIKFRFPKENGADAGFFA